MTRLKINNKSRRKHHLIIHAPGHQLTSLQCPFNTASQFVCKWAKSSIEWLSLCN